MQSNLETTGLISSDKVGGTNVYNTAGEKLGSIETVMIDRVSGNVRYAVLEFGGFLGMGTDRYPLPWSALEYDHERDGYVVPLDKERLKDAPRYGSGENPNYTDAYGREVYDYYGARWDI
ncbi:MAG: PRC-barrel domain-containing protein [Proteobacteria bacterium]|nr:PRC-barrel domain-containing protein [Pseudomonadota bacterium]